jgi:DNA replication protein DnaC
MSTTIAESLGQTPRASTERTCRECAKPFEVPTFIPASIAAKVHVCPSCSERHAAETSRRAIEQSQAVRLARWKQICPPEFLQTDPNKLPCQRQYRAVMNWICGHRGLVLHGPTGQGKSRCAWLLLRREYEAGRSVRSLNSASGLTYAAKFSESAKDAERWIERLSEVDLLLLDDCFKAKLTDSFEAALFAVINTRTERQLPIIATLNDTGSTLLERLTPDRGAAMLRRLREFCDSISFA